MALTGAWKDARSVSAGARKWGTGINPVHAERRGDGRAIAIAGSEPVTALLTTEYDDDGWTGEPWAAENHEDIRDVGMFDRPNYGDNPQHARKSVGDFPEWGPYAQGIPGGTSIRTHKHGSDDQQTPNQNPTETVSEGWRNKVHGDVEDSVTADIAQVLMQTSAVQRDKVREGSQRSGSQSEYSAPIQSRITGQRIKVYSGERRHEDMRPKSHSQRLRGFWNRTAGTANPRMLEPNAQVPVTPRTRTVPADPYTGPPVSDAANYGYMDEDQVPYA